MFDKSDSYIRSRTDSTQQDRSLREEISWIKMKINMLLGSKAHFAELAPAKVGLGPGGDRAK